MGLADDTMAQSLVCVSVPDEEIRAPRTAGGLCMIGFDQADIFPGKIDGRVLVQGDQRQIVGLIRHAPVEPPVLNDDIRGNVALAANLFPLQLSGGAADLAGLWRWILELAAGGAVLQD